jgi:ElaB/YqjD/DUF883 family membrane-anchored ribosome-binding protein
MKKLSKRHNDNMIATAGAIDVPGKMHSEMCEWVRKTLEGFSMTYVGYETEVHKPIIIDYKKFNIDLSDTRQYKRFEKEFDDIANNCEDLKPVIVLNFGKENKAKYFPAKSGSNPIIYLVRNEEALDHIDSKNVVENSIYHELVHFMQDMITHALKLMDEDSDIAGDEKARKRNKIRRQIHDIDNKMLSEDDLSYNQRIQVDKVRNFSAGVPQKFNPGSFNMYSNISSRDTKEDLDDFSKWHARSDVEF